MSSLYGRCAVSMNERSDLLIFLNFNILMSKKNDKGATKIVLSVKNPR